MTELAQSPSAKQFHGHAVHNALEQWRTKLPSERPDSFRELDAEPRNSYVRLRWVLRELRARLDRLNPFLAQPAVLDAINKQIAGLQGPWDQYRSDPTQHWQALDSSTESLLNQVRNLPASDGSHAATEVLEELRADMDAAIKKAQTAIQQLQSTAEGTDKRFQDANEKLQGLASEIQAQKARLDQMLTQQSETFTKAEQDRVTQFTKAEQDRSQRFSQAQDEKKAQFDALVTEFNESRAEAVAQHQQAQQQRAEAFTKSQAERKEQHDSLVETFNTTQAELFDQHKTAVATLTKELTDESGATLSKIQEQLDKAVEIVGTIVKTTMSGNYQIVANREYRNAWVMRGVAVLSFVVMGLMIIWAVSSMHFAEDGIEWGTFAFRLSLGTAFLIPGIYCAKEASRHWSAEKQNRRISLELAALDPFLVKLDEAKRKEVIERMAREYFGAKMPQEDGEDPLSLKDMHFIQSVVLESMPRHVDEMIETLPSIAASIRSAAEESLGLLYPPEADGSRPAAYLWARCVRCEAPNCGAEIPLVRSFWLAKRAHRRRALRYDVVWSDGDAPSLVLEVFEPDRDGDVPGGTVNRAKAT